MRCVPVWGLAASAAAPALLIGGWTIAAHLQPAGFDSTRESISALAGADASARWVMTVAILGAGICQLAVGIGLHPAAPAGRWFVAVAGVATCLVALNPLPAASHRSTAHALFATISFVALAVWPLVGWRSGDRIPWGLRRTVATAAGCTLIGLTLWFFGVSLAGGPHLGLAERIAAACENGWLFVVTLSAWRLL
jgi:hypothetical membrane protein